MIKHARVIAVAAALATLPTIASAQDKQFNVGTKLVNVGLLLGSSSYGSAGVGGGLEVGFKNIEDKVVLGIGGSIGLLRSSESGFAGLGGYSFTTIPVLGFVHGHYQVPSVPKLDLYAGPAVGVSLSRFSYDDDNFCKLLSSNCSLNDTAASIGIQAGARYALTPTVLGWGQLSGGNNMPFVNLGVSFKF